MIINSSHLWVIFEHLFTEVMGFLNLQGVFQITVVPPNV